MLSPVLSIMLHNKAIVKQSTEASVLGAQGTTTLDHHMNNYDVRTGMGWILECAGALARKKVLSSGL